MPALSEHCARLADDLESDQDDQRLDVADGSSGIVLSPDETLSGIKHLAEARCLAQESVQSSRESMTDIKASQDKDSGFFKRPISAGEPADKGYQFRPALRPKLNFLGNRKCPMLADVSMRASESPSREQMPPCTSNEGDVGINAQTEMRNLGTVRVPLNDIGSIQNCLATNTVADLQLAPSPQETLVEESLETDGDLRQRPETMIADSIEDLPASEPPLIDASACPSKGTPSMGKLARYLSSLCHRIKIEERTSQGKHAAMIQTQVKLQDEIKSQRELLEWYDMNLCKDSAERATAREKLQRLQTFVKATTSDLNRLKVDQNCLNEQISEISEHRKQLVNHVAILQNASNLSDRWLAVAQDINGGLSKELHRTRGALSETDKRNIELNASLERERGSADERWKSALVTCGKAIQDEIVKLKTDLDMVTRSPLDTSKFDQCLQAIHELPKESVDLTPVWGKIAELTTSVDLTRNSLSTKIASVKDYQEHLATQGLIEEQVTGAIRQLKADFLKCQDMQIRNEALQRDKSELENDRRLQENISSHLMKERDRLQTALSSSEEKRHQVEAKMQETISETQVDSQELAQLRQNVIQAAQLQAETESLHAQINQLNEQIREHTQAKESLAKDKEAMESDVVLAREKVAELQKAQKSLREEIEASIRDDMKASYQKLEEKATHNQKNALYQAQQDSDRWKADKAAIHVQLDSANEELRRIRESSQAEKRGLQDRVAALTDALQCYEERLGIAGTAREVAEPSVLTDGPDKQTVVINLREQRRQHRVSDAIAVPEREQNIQSTTPNRSDVVRVAKIHGDTRSTIQKDRPEEENSTVNHGMSRDQPFGESIPWLLGSHIDTAASAPAKQKDLRHPHLESLATETTTISPVSDAGPLSKVPETKFPVMEMEQRQADRSLRGDCISPRSRETEDEPSHKRRKASRQPSAPSTKQRQLPACQNLAGTGAGYIGQPEALSTGQSCAGSEILDFDELTSTPVSGWQTSQPAVSKAVPNTVEKAQFAGPRTIFDLTAELTPSHQRNLRSASYDFGEESRETSEVLDTIVFQKTLPHNMPNSSSKRYIESVHERTSQTASDKASQSLYLKPLRRVSLRRANIADNAAMTTNADQPSWYQGGASKTSKTHFSGKPSGRSSVVNSTSALPRSGAMLKRPKRSRTIEFKDSDTERKVREHLVDFNSLDQPQQVDMRQSKRVNLGWSPSDRRVSQASLSKDFSSLPAPGLETTTRQSPIKTTRQTTRKPLGKLRQISKVGSKAAGA